MIAVSRWTSCSLRKAAINTRKKSALDSAVSNSADRRMHSSSLDRSHERHGASARPMDPSSMKALREGAGVVAHQAP